MGTQHTDTARRPMSEFTQSKARAQRELTDQRNRAVRTVARLAHDKDEFTGLLSMLGLDDGNGGGPALSYALPTYVRQVAAEMDIPGDAIGYEVSDTATAYLGLPQRWPDRPGRDLMLVWDERLGWYVGVETRPDEAAQVVCYLGGDAVPTPAAVARFVTDAVAGRYANRLRPVLPPCDRVALGRRMAAHR